MTDESLETIKCLTRVAMAALYKNVSAKVIAMLAGFMTANRRYVHQHASRQFSFALDDYPLCPAHIHCRAFILSWAQLCHRTSSQPFQILHRSAIFGLHE